MNRHISKIITAMRFPTCVMVVFAHSTLSVNMEGINSSVGSVYSLIHNLISYGLCASLVPLFFLISGYLYFKGFELHYGWNDYIEKNRRRVRTLVVPYLLWNFLTLLLFWVVQSLMPNMTSGNYTLIADYSIKDWLLAFWNVDEGFPIDGPMWFIRDLIIISAISIVIHPLVKNKVIGLLIIALSLIMGIIGGYFIVGAWLGVHGIDFVKYCKRAWLISTIGYFVLVVINLALEGTIHNIIEDIHIFMGVVAITGLLGSIYEKRELGRNMLFLSGTYFFIYACHQYPLLMLCKLWKKVMPASDVLDIAGYFVLPILIICIIIFVYRTMQRIAPSVLAALTGGRS